MDLFFVSRVLRCFVFILKVIERFQHFGELLYFHLVVGLDLERFFLIWLLLSLLFAAAWPRLARLGLFDSPSEVPP